MGVEFSASIQDYFDSTGDKLAPPSSVSGDEIGKKQGGSYCDVIKWVTDAQEDDIRTRRFVIESNTLWLFNSLVVIVRWGGAIPSMPGICEWYGI